MSKKTLIILTILLFVFKFSYAQQGINTNWIMGYASWGGLPNGNTLLNFFLVALLLTMIVLKWNLITLIQILVIIAETFFSILMDTI